MATLSPSAANPAPATADRLPDEDLSRDQALAAAAARSRVFLRVLPWLLCANVLLALTSLCGVVLTVIGEARVIPRAQVGALLLNLALDVVLIRRLGFVGAGLGIIAGQGALLLLLLVLMARARVGAYQLLEAR